MPQAVSCCWYVSSRYGHLKVCHVLLHVGRSWSLRGSEIFLRTAICSACCKVRSKAPVQPRCWCDRTAGQVQSGIDTADWHSACVTQNCTSLAQIQMIHIVVGNLLCYTLLQDCNHGHTWPIAKHTFSSSVLYTTALLHIGTLLTYLAHNYSTPSVFQCST